MPSTLLMACISAALSAPFDSQGHRGARGLFSENSIPSFYGSPQSSDDHLGLDTTLTKDGRLIVHHDTQTNPSICLSAQQEPIESQPIRQLTADYLRTLECGLLPQERFPSSSSWQGQTRFRWTSLLQQIEGLVAKKGFSRATISS